MPGIINTTVILFFKSHTSEHTDSQASSTLSSLTTIVRRWAYLVNIFQHELLPLLDKENMASHPVSAWKPKIMDNTKLGSCSVTKWAGTHFTTVAVPGSIQSYQ